MAEYVHCNFSSRVLGMPVDISILLPSRCWQQENERKEKAEYQTLYLLHGFNGNHLSYIRFSDIEKYVDTYQIVVVMPSMYNSAYTDMKYGLEYFTYFTEEMMYFIEETFPVSTKREDRFIAGMSMGGYGAYKVGLSCPDRFAAIAGMAGSYHAEYRYQGKVTTISTLCEALYGDPPAITPEVHDVFTIMKNLKDAKKELPRMYTCCGTEDRRYQDSVDLKEFADKEGIPLTFEDGPGRHDMEFFNAYLPRVLEWMHLKTHM